MTERPIEGVGLGLRSPHYQTILAERPPVPWFEVLIDNYFGAGGPPLYYLERIRELYPIVFHGVGMSLGSTDPLNQDYLRRLGELARRFQPAWISDHLCWSSVGGHALHDLLPLPYNEEVIRHVAGRIRQVQDQLGRRILIENVSSYGQVVGSELNEWDFLSAVSEEADCSILLDINNIYVNSFNHNFKTDSFLKAVPKERVREFHLAGYDDHGDYLLDTHGAAVSDPVWELYRQALEHFGPVPTLIEWDADIPAFATLQQQALRAAQINTELFSTDDCEIRGTTRSFA